MVGLGANAAAAAKEEEDEQAQEQEQKGQEQEQEFLDFRHLFKITDMKGSMPAVLTRQAVF